MIVDQFDEMLEQSRQASAGLRHLAAPLHHRPAVPPARLPPRDGPHPQAPRRAVDHDARRNRALLRNASRRTSCRNRLKIALQGRVTVRDRPCAPADAPAARSRMPVMVQLPSSRMTAVCAIDIAQRGILLRQDDRQPFRLLDLVQDFADTLDDDRREAERRLVEQEDRRLRHQRAADREHLLLAAGQAAGALAGALLQAREIAEDPLDALRNSSPGAGIGADLQVFQRPSWPGRRAALRANSRCRAARSRRAAALAASRRRAAMSPSG